MKKYAVRTKTTIIDLMINQVFLNKEISTSLNQNLFSLFQVIERNRLDLNLLSSLKNIEFLEEKSRLEEAYFSCLLNKNKIRQNRLKEIIKTNKTNSDYERLFSNLYKSVSDYSILDGSDLSEKIIKSTYLELKENVSEANKSLANVSSRFSKAMGSLLPPYSNDVSSLLNSLLKELKLITRKNDSNLLLSSIAFAACFLAISPFEFYNVQMGLLLLNYLLFKFGYDFNKYRSLSKFIYKDKKEFNLIIRRLRNGYQKNKLDCTQFIEFTLSKLGEIYSSLSYSYSLISSKGKSKDKIYKLIKESNAPITKETIEETLFIYSKTTIEKSLGELSSETRIKLINSGRHSTYILSSSSSSIFIF